MGVIATISYILYIVLFLAYLAQFHYEQDKYLVKPTPFSQQEIEMEVPAKILNP